MSSTIPELSVSPEATRLLRASIMLTPVPATPLPSAVIVTSTNLALCKSPDPDALTVAKSISPSTQVTKPDVATSFVLLPVVQSVQVSSPEPS